MQKDIESFKDSPIKNQRNDDVWKDISAGISKVDMLDYKNPSLVELSEPNQKLAGEMAEAAKASLALIKAEGAMMDAGLNPLAISPGEKNAALDREEEAIDSMREMIKDMRPAQAGAVLAGANELLQEVGVRFAVNKFGGVALVENEGVIFPLGKPHSENSAKLQGPVSERHGGHGRGHGGVHGAAHKSVDELVYGSAFKSVPKTAIYS